MSARAWPKAWCPRGRTSPSSTPIRSAWSATASSPACCEDRFFKRPFPCPTAPRARQNRGGTQRPKRLEPVLRCRLRSVGRGPISRSCRRASFSSAVCGVPLVVGPHPSVSRALGRSRLQRPWSPGCLNCRGWAASGRLQRLASSWRASGCQRLQPQVREDLLNHRLLTDRCNDLQLAAAVRAAL